MTRPINLILTNKLLRAAFFCFGLLLSTSSPAALVDLATAPLANSTTSLVLPNLMYVLDNSGSMRSDYMPDYVNDNNKCKSTDATGTFSASCGFGDPAYNLKDFNTLYYDPAITYLPGLNADGTAKSSMTSANTAGWTDVPNDAYGIRNIDQLGNSSTSISFIPNGANTQGYPDKVWCNTGSATVTDLTDPSVCNQNSQYIFPTSVFNNSYTLRVNPYYYLNAPTQYCADKNLTPATCQATADATHTFPATLRWCTSSGLGTCQATYTDSTYTYAKWLGLTTGSLDGTIKFKPTSLTPGASPVALSVTDVKVNGVTIISPPVSYNIIDTTSLAQRQALAAALASNINSFTSAPDYTAVASSDTVVISQAIPSASFAGTITMTTPPHTTGPVGGVAASGSITVTNAISGTSTVANVKVNGVEIMGGGGSGCGIASSTSSSGSGSTRRAALASAIAARITSCVSSPEFTATSSGSTVTITASAVGSSVNGAIVPSTFTNSALVNSGTMAGGVNAAPLVYTIPNQIGNFTGNVPVVSTFSRVDIEPSTPNYPKVAARTDCTGAVGPTGCSYAEEMTNFANWYSYYRTRMQMMKTSTSRAFKNIDTRYRVGFITINSTGTYYLPIATFDATQKTNWYTKLFSADGSSSTPLRSALTDVGRIFAGKGSAAVGNAADPMQYSCQQNFTLLTTDGYWNSDAASDVKNINGTGTVGNMDGGTSSPTSAYPRPLYEGATASSETLADAAKYYYDTDLRDSSLSNCTGSAGVDVCNDNVFVSSTDNNVQQHMTTYTLGLGVDGTLSYASDYKTQTSGDFHDVFIGTKEWPVPAQNSQTAVDDLWHAAVNGRGTYFSAKNPTQLTTSLSDTLSSITSKIGAGAAAATSTLNPVAGDNFAYVASYATVKWTGNIEARTIDINTGEVSADAAWCTENVAASTCGSPGTIVTDTTGSSTNYFCSTSGATLATCPAPGIFDSGTNTCNVEIASACVGTMATKVAASADTRTILMNSSGTLVPFNYTNLFAAGKATNFQSTFLAANLSQWASLTPTQQASAPGANIVNFLRGQTGFEERASNVVGPIDNRLFRFREAVIGDPLESTPAFNGIPKATYTDPGYGAATVPGTFAYAQASRDGTVYIGTNDGMLHAFDADNGVERWAYVPSAVIPNMWRLADKNYSNLHTNYVNGDAIINDVCTANCTTASATWKTILVGGLNGGGQGYYALDITDPDNPLFLWEFGTSNDNDLGYTFGNPVITKKADGTWVVLITSGYNNVGGSNPGKGFLYVLNANTGAVITKYGTGAGDATTPSGLAKISAFITDAQKNNTALNIYGGDLLGNLWRFDINAASSSSNPLKLATLEGPTTIAPIVSVPQPITVKPELSEVDGKRIIFVGTGKYLEPNDLSTTATATARQTLYAITDANETTTLANPRGSSAMVQQVITNSGATRTVTNNAVDYGLKRGWYIDLPDTGERQNVPAQLVFGTLLVPTIVPSNTVCSPGGYGWLNFLNFKTGSIIAQSIVGAKTNAPIVGLNILYVKGQPKVSVVTADNPTPEFPAVQPEFTGGSLSGFQDHRVIWRELIDEQQ